MTDTDKQVADLTARLSKLESCNRWRFLRAVLLGLGLVFSAAIYGALPATSGSANIFAKSLVIQNGENGPKIWLGCAKIGRTCFIRLSNPDDQDLLTLRTSIGRADILFHRKNGTNSVSFGEDSLLITDGSSRVHLGPGFIQVIENERTLWHTYPRCKGFC